MFKVEGWRDTRWTAPTANLIASFMEDGSIREAAGESEDGTWNLLGSWQWKHDECCIEVCIPGQAIELNLENAVTSYLSWLAKQVVN